MTLDEKLSYIGGINWMYTRPLERFGIPQLKMSDGHKAGNTRPVYCLSRVTDAWLAPGNEQLAYGIRKRPGVKIAAHEEYMSF